MIVMKTKPIKEINLRMKSFNFEKARKIHNSICDRCKEKTTIYDTGSNFECKKCILEAENKNIFHKTTLINFQGILLIP